VNGHMRMRVKGIQSPDPAYLYNSRLARFTGTEHEDSGNIVEIPRNLG
jgi:hypothetical protein